MLAHVQLNWHSYSDGGDMYWHEIPQNKMALYCQETFFKNVSFWLSNFTSRNLSGIETLDWDWCIKMFITMSFTKVEKDLKNPKYFIGKIIKQIMGHP